MYHYVRPIKQSPFPGIKGLEIDGFKRQLDYLEENYTIIPTEDVIAAVNAKSKLPDKACWLTFDDGYKDHYKYVLPELLKRKIKAAFFPPKHAIMKRELLDVNAIHHILANCEEINDLLFKLKKTAVRFGMKERHFSELETKFKKKSRYDNAETLCFKRLLQVGLPEEIRVKITNSFFSDYLGLNTQDFASQLYMSLPEISDLVKQGMFVGSHGSKHLWLNTLSENEQEDDIRRSFELLEAVGAERKNWIMCYPYGGYNSTTLSIIKKLGACIGLTTKPKKANLIYDNVLSLPRFDTNDFPQ